MSWLKSATLAAGLPKNSIIQALKTRMQGYEDARDHLIVHASDVTKNDFCPRRWAFYGLTSTKPKGGWVGAALRATFDLGHAMAKEFIENWCKDFAVGNWKCSTCGTCSTMSNKPKEGCLKSGQGRCNWEYCEVQFESKEYGISGSIDVFLDLGGLGLMTTELKTYAADEFDKMKTVLPEHKCRTRLYLKIIADSSSPWKSKINLHSARVLYVSRGFGRMNDEYKEILPFREFIVDRSDQDLDVLIALNKAKQVKTYRTHQLMPSGICATPLDKTAKTCSHCQLCFSGKYPSAQEPLVTT